MLLPRRRRAKRKEVAVEKCGKEFLSLFKLTTKIAAMRRIPGGVFAAVHLHQAHAGFTTGDEPSTAKSERLSPRYSEPAMRGSAFHLECATGAPRIIQHRERAPQQQWRSIAASPALPGSESAPLFVSIDSSRRERPRKRSACPPSGSEQGRRLENRQLDRFQRRSLETKALQFHAPLTRLGPMGSFVSAGAGLPQREPSRPA